MTLTKVTVEETGEEAFVQAIEEQYDRYVGFKVTISLSDPIKKIPEAIFFHITLPNIELGLSHRIVSSLKVYSADPILYDRLVEV